MTYKDTSSAFQASRLEDWAKQTEATLKGGSITDLDRLHEDGFAIRAFYSSESHRKPLSDAVSAAAPRSWMMAQYVDIADDEKQLNSMILDELTGGTERLIFPSGQPLDRISKAMDGVRAEAIILSYDRPQDMPEALSQLTRIWIDQNTPSDLARGALGATVNPTSWQDISAFMKAQAATLERFPSLRIMKISGSTAHRNGGTVAQELGIILATFVDMMRRAEADGFALDEILTRIEIDLAIDADLYGNIAKARSLRMLLSRLCAMLGCDGTDLTARLHGITSDRMLSRLDAETNMLRSGTAMLSMALSGLGIITNRPHDWLTGSTPLSRRIARNAHHVLADEAQLMNIADPAQGSYFIDSLTCDISDKAWQIFQAIEQEGGLANAEAGGLIKAWFEDAIAYRQDSINQGKDALLGVTIHPATGIDILPEIVSDGAEARGGAHRPAAIWETMVMSFRAKKARCLLLDLGADPSAKAVKGRLDILGIETVTMMADNSVAGLKLITTAQPDLLILGDDSSINDADLAKLPKPPILRKAKVFQGDIIAEMTEILNLINERVES